MPGLLTWLRGLLLLRHADVVREMGERRLRALRIQEIVRQFPTARIERDVILLGWERDRLQLGQSATLGSGTILSFGDEQNGFGKINVGTKTWIGQYNNLRAGGGDIQIGQNCLISQFCTLVATNHGIRRELPVQQQPPDSTRSGIRLGDDVWLGAGVVVTPGVTVGDGAVIGANAVVTSNVPDYEIWAGVPARRIGVRE